MSQFTKLLVQFALFLKREAPRASIYGGGTGSLIWLASWFPKATNHPEFAPLLTCSYMILILVAVAHFIRRVLFHKLDLQAVAVRAIEEKNIAAAVVFAAIIQVLVAAMFILAKMLS